MGWLTNLTRTVSRTGSNMVRGTVGLARDAGGGYLNTSRMLLRNPALPGMVAAGFGASGSGSSIPGLDLGQAMPLYGQGGGFAGFAKAGAGGGLIGFGRDVLAGAGGKVLGDVVGGWSDNTGGGYGTGGNVPATTGGTNADAIIQGAGKRGIFPALPDDINSLIALRNAGFTLRAADLLHVPRSPDRRFVVVRPWNDDRYIGMRRELAIKMGLFHPGKKPIISVSQSNALRKANSAIKALKRANSMAKKVANFNPGGRKALPAPTKKGR